MPEVHHSELARGIKIVAEPEPLEAESSPDHERFVFAYTITIENTTEQTVQLLERHWKIYSADTQIGEVVGSGVVGLQPTLSKGESFTYTSSAVIKDPVGAMQGSYTFQAPDRTRFEVEIPRFELLYTLQLN